jgi:hypothetical protein
VRVAVAVIAASVLTGQRLDAPLLRGKPEAGDETPSADETNLHGPYEGADPVGAFVGRNSALEHAAFLPANMEKT